MKYLVARSTILLLATIALHTPAEGVALPRDTEPPVILVLAPEWAAEDEEIVLRARVSDASRVGDVILWVRGEYDKDFRAVPMRSGGLDGHSATLGFWPGQGNRVTYYVEATDRLGNGPRRSGSPSSPFVARHEPLPEIALESTGLSYPMAMGLFLPPLVLLWLVHRRELANRERVFWMRLLASLRDKRGRELASGIEEVCAKTHRHPRRGVARVSKLEARQWLEHLRGSALPAQQFRK